MSECDIVVWGATGFTGRLVARYLNETCPDDVSWAIAGRNEAKLRSVAESLGLDVPMIIADSDDEASIADLVARARVVCTTVGPYAKYGSKLVAACADAGVHYCDLTGEVPWMRRMIDAHHTRAEETGARIVHTCGFDSIPFDMGVHFAQGLMQERHGVYATEVHGRAGDSRGGFSGGTVDSMMNMLDEAKVDRTIFDILGDPYALNPLNMPRGPDKPDSMGVRYDNELRQWTGPFIMAGVNTRVVRRSHALKKYPYGQDFSYEEAMLTGNGPGGFAAASAMSGGFMAVGGLMFMGPTRRMLRRMMPEAGEGPSEETMTNGYWNVEMLALHPEDASKNVQVHLHGDRDPGYGSTSKMLAESALCLASDPLESSGGVLTPAVAMGDALVERLNTRAGVSFQVVDAA